MLQIHRDSSLMPPEVSAAWRALSRAHLLEGVVFGGVCAGLFVALLLEMARGNAEAFSALRQSLAALVGATPPAPWTVWAPLTSLHTAIASLAVGVVALGVAGYRRFASRSRIADAQRLVREWTCLPRDSRFAAVRDLARRIAAYDVAMAVTLDDAVRRAMLDAEALDAAIAADEAPGVTPLEALVHARQAQQNGVDQLVQLVRDVRAEVAAGQLTLRVPDALARVGAQLEVHRTIERARRSSVL